MMRVLLLGGTSEASQLARALAAADVDAVFSYAGRTDDPIPQPLPTRVGGFGGIDGLVAYIEGEGITHVVDATHPFASRMSANAIAATRSTGARLLALERPPWQEQAGDRWRHVATVDAAVRDLPEAPTRIFLSIGRQNIAEFRVRPQHHYLLRLIDAPRSPLPLPDCKPLVARAPFSVDGELDLLRRERIGWLVSKNAGGDMAGAKIAAARILGIAVTMIARPDIPDRPVIGRVGDVLRWLGVDHVALRGV